MPDLVVTDKRSKYDGLVLPGQESRGSTGLSIKDAAKAAEPYIDIAANALKDDAVFVPTGDRVLARRIPEAVKTIGGITLPSTGKTPAAFGVVVGVGQGRYNLVGQLIPVRVQVGAVVMFGKYAGTDIQIFGQGQEPCVSLREEEIMGVVMSKDAAAKVRALADPPIGTIPSE